MKRPWDNRRDSGAVDGTRRKAIRPCDLGQPRHRTGVEHPGQGCLNTEAVLKAKTPRPGKVPLLSGDVASRETLLVLDEIRKRQGGRAPHIRPELIPKLDYVVRRTLEVAILATDIARSNEEDAEGIQDWFELRKRAEKSERAMRHLLEWMDPSRSRDAGRIGSVLGQTRLGRVEVHLRSGPRGRARKSREQLDAGALLRSAAVLSELAADAERRRRLFASTRQNPGEAEKRAFVLELGRGWTYLMGRSPSAERDGPFVFLSTPLGVIGTAKTTAGQVISLRARWNPLLPRSGVRHRA